VCYMWLYVICFMLCVICAYMWLYAVCSADISYTLYTVTGGSGDIVNVSIILSHTLYTHYTHITHISHYRGQ
jgi:hypothetical protein